MIGFILLIVLTALLWWGCFYCDKHKRDCPAFVHALFACFSSVGLLFAIVFLCVLPSDTSEFCEARIIRANLVESINDNMSTETVSQIIGNAISTNNRIEKHRRNVDNVFIGCFFSHKIAETELIPIPKIGIVENKEE